MLSTLQRIAAVGGGAAIAVAVDFASEKTDDKIREVFQEMHLSRGPQLLHRKVLAWWNPPSPPPPPPKRHDALPPSER